MPVDVLGIADRLRAGAGDEVLATANPLQHHCEVVPISGNSYRFKNRLQAIERDTKGLIFSWNKGVPLWVSSTRGRAGGRRRCRGQGPPG
jgi:hypothetical protein